MFQLEHEEWWQQWEYYKKRRRDLMRDWSRDRTELLNRVQVIFHEACFAEELFVAQQHYRDEQANICQELYDQVSMVFERWKAS